MLDRKGSQQASLPAFVVGDEWTLTWSYDCSAFGQAGNFIVDIKDVDTGSSSDNQGLNQLAVHGSGIEHYYSGGRLQLVIESECTWHVTVVDVRS